MKYLKVKLSNCIKFFIKDNNSLLILFFILISPFFMFYLTNKRFTFFLPVSVASQLAMLFLLAGIFKKRFLVCLFISIFLLTAFLHWAHFFMYRYELTDGAIAAILSTNFREAIEFIFIIPKVFWIFFIFLNVYIVYLFKRTPEIIRFSSSQLTGFILIILLSIFLKLGINRNVAKTIDDIILKSQPLKTIITINRGYQLLKNFNSQISAIKTMNLDITNIGFDKNQIHVVIIGESARRSSWSAYKYFRDTNMYTSKIKDSLLFKDVISSANATISSIARTLTYTDKNGTANILKEAERFGFNTFWLSNQGQFGLFDNSTTLIANQAMVKSFINTDTSSTSFDGGLLTELEKALAVKSKKKLIFIHLMGSHFYYSRRYPKEFDKFKGTEVITRGNYKTSDFNTINEYDNSILYTDYIISKIVNRVKDEKTFSSVLYFSDHGENLFETKDEFGHGGMNISKKEVEVPMYLWLSKNFINDQPQLVSHISANLSKEISLYDFLPSYLYFLGLKTKIDGRKNFFAPFISPNDRIIFNQYQQKVFYKDLK